MCAHHKCSVRAMAAGVCRRGAGGGGQGVVLKLLKFSSLYLLIVLMRSYQQEMTNTIKTGHGMN